MEKTMLKEENKIFKNLYNDYGWEIDSAIKRDDWKDTKSFISNVHKIKESKKKFNLIINAFYSVRRLDNFVSYKFFVEKSLLNISEVLDVVNPKLINKIIYTSSSSVYGSVNSKLNIPDRNNRYIYSSFKISAENLIKNFSNTGFLSECLTIPAELAVLEMVDLVKSSSIYKARKLRKI